MNRRESVAGVLRGIIRKHHPLTRIALGIGSNHGWIAGRGLAAALPTDQRRRAAAALLRDEQVVVRFRHDQEIWNIPSGDLILADMLADGCYETEELDPLLAWCTARRRPKSRSTVIEVGANVGTTTVPLCRRGQYVIAFEPIPRLRSLLIENLEANGVQDSASVHALAISARECEVDMRLSDSGSSEIVEDSAEAIVARRGPAYFDGRQATDSGERLIRVIARPLDSVLTDLGVQAQDVLVVWSDTEGAETGVVAGGSRLWAAGVPLWLEVWPTGLDEHGGLGVFIDTITEHFVGFVDRDDLISQSDQAPIQDLETLQARLVDALNGKGAQWSTDVLLVPSDMSAVLP